MQADSRTSGCDGCQVGEEVSGLAVSGGHLLSWESRAVAVAVAVGVGMEGFDASCVDEWLEVEKWEGLTSADSSTTPPAHPQARRTRPSGLVENAVVAIRCHPDRRGRTRAPPP